MGNLLRNRISSNGTLLNVGINYESFNILRNKTTKAYLCLFMFCDACHSFGISDLNTTAFLNSLSFIAKQEKYVNIYNSYNDTNFVGVYEL